MPLSPDLPSPGGAISEITTPDSYLGREHFASFASLSSFTLRQAFWSFNGCAITAAGRHADRKHLFVPPTDLIVKPRNEVGLKVYPHDQLLPGNRTMLGRELAQYAIEAGSIVAGKPFFEEAARRKAGNAYFAALARRLESQFT